MKGIIYKIICNITNNIYIGSTTKKLNIRMSKHKYDCKKNKSCRSKEILKNNDFTVEPIEEIEFNNKIELHERERYYITNNICVNKVIPNRTQKEYRENNKNKIKKNANEKFDCPCGGCYTRSHKAEHNKTNKHIKYLENLK